MATNESAMAIEESAGADGTNERGLAVATIQEQKGVVIEPAPSSFAGAGF